MKMSRKSVNSTNVPYELKIALGSFRVQARSCRTCIYHNDSSLNIEALEKRVRDPHVGFKSFRVCHHSDDACCRGFWNRHKDEFAAGQIAQRLGLVAYVHDDTWSESEDAHA